MFRKAVPNFNSVRSLSNGLKFGAMPQRFSRSSVSMPTQQLKVQNTFLGQSSAFAPADLSNARSIHTGTVAQAAVQPFTLKTVQDRLMLVLSLYDKIDPEQLKMESNFFTDLGLDSLDYVEMIMMIEDEFLFEIPEGDSDRFKTPRDIFQYICDRNDVYH